MRVSASGTLILLAFVPAIPANAQVQQADLGRCELEMGGTIEDCTLGYRTAGRLAPGRDNAILIPTWFGSGADDWLPLLGREGIVDTTASYVIIVESLGAGLSSSPSSSRRHQGAEFPEITVGDMVEASYRLVREHFSLPELKAVVGISLGGMQAFEWAVRYPDFVRAVVPIAGSPRQTPYQRLVWEAIAATATEGARGTLSQEAASQLLGRMGMLILTSPEAINQIERDRYEGRVAREVGSVRKADLFTWAWQGRAIAGYDASHRFGGDLMRAAEQWNGRALVVVSPRDHSISPGPAEEFAQLTGARLLSLEGPQGHIAIFSDKDAWATIRTFLKQ